MDPSTLLSHLPTILCPFNLSVNATTHLSLTIKGHHDPSSPFLLTLSTTPPFRLEVPSTTTQTQLLHIILGALTPMALPLAEPPPVLSAPLPHPIVESHPCVPQWHHNTCGYHALFNAIHMLHGLSTLTDDVHFWSMTAHFLAELEAHRARTGLWATSNLENGMLDESHTNYLIGSQNISITLVSSLEELDSVLLPALQLARDCNRRHAFILGLETHWIALCLVGHNKIAIADPHNKPYPSLRTFADCHLEAVRLVEGHRPVFCERLRALQPALLAEAPPAVLHAMYDEGIPEFWKGQAKHPVWWTNRPSSVRVALLQSELEAGMLLCRALLHALGGPPPRLLLDSGPVRPLTQGMSTSHALAELSSLRPHAVRCAHQGIPPEMPFDVFDRQRVMLDFDQSLVEAQACLVVGCGAIGQNVALLLARLGVDEIILIDRDQIEASNLPRQCLVNARDVGRPKVHAARDELVRSHALRSRVTALHVDVVESWSQVVVQAKRATAVFNCCDAGLMVDLALTSLAKELSVPLLQGQSMGWKLVAEAYLPSSACAFCYEGTRSTFGLGQDGLFARLRQSGLSLPEFFRADLGVARPLEWLEAAAAAAETAADVAALVSRYHDEALALLLPGSVSQQQHLGFAPLPRQPPTRSAGALVASAAGCAAALLGLWANALTGPGARVPPQLTLVNLDEGFAGFSQTGQAEESSDRCSVCAAAAQLRQAESVWWGSARTRLRRVPGSWALCVPVFKQDMAGVRVPVARFPGTDPLARPQTLYLPGWGSCALLRVADGHGTVPTAVASGRRSAVWRTPGGWMRIKGCGLDELGGFGESDQGPRGCMFEETALREMTVGAAVARALQRERGWITANTPLGYACFPGEGDKVCVLFETRGERRLGDHLLPGLVALLRKAGVGEPHGDDELVPTYLKAICGMPLRDWRQNAEGEIGLILRLAWRLGAEAAAVLRVLHGEGVCWGSFPDKAGVHCNAHANNLVVLAGLPRKDQLLAPLDFDMAYTREGFLATGNKGGQAQQLFPEDWEGVCKFEWLAGMRATLAGSEFASTGVAGVDEWDWAEVMLRDCVVGGFDEERGALGQVDQLDLVREVMYRALEVTRERSV